MDPLVWSILILLLGILLIVLEVFIPSGGVLSVLAGVSVVASIVVAFSGGVLQGVVMLLAATVLVPVVVVLAIHWWPHTPLGRLILIQRPEHPDDVLPDSEELRELKALVGKRGVARTKMLPSGAVRIGGRTYDAVSEGMPIEAEQPVLVVALRTNRIVVRPSDAPPESPQEETDQILSQPIDSLGIDPFEDPLA